MLRYKSEISIYFFLTNLIRKNKHIFPLIVFLVDLVHALWYKPFILHKKYYRNTKIFTCLRSSAVHDLWWFKILVHVQDVRHNKLNIKIYLTKVSPKKIHLEDFQKSFPKTCLTVGVVMILKKYKCFWEKTRISEGNIKIVNMLNFEIP